VIYHGNPKAFVDSAADYGAIGRALVVLSNLEFSHDQLMLTVSKVHPSLATKLRPTFPRQYRQKVDFLIGLLVELPKLRRIPIIGNSLNLIWLQYQLDELYEVRNVIAHGSIFYTEKGEGGFSWKFDRVVKGSSGGTWTIASTFIGSSFLADVVNTAMLLKLYLGTLDMAVQDQFDWEKHYKEDCEMRANARVIKEEINAGLYAADDWILQLVSHYDAE